MIKCSEKILKKQEKKAKLSQEKVAEEINTSRSNISKYENETLEPNIETLKRLCELYGVSADYIIGITINNQQSSREIKYKETTKELKIKE